MLYHVWRHLIPLPSLNFAETLYQLNLEVQTSSLDVSIKLSGQIYGCDIRTFLHSIPLYYLFIYIIITNVNVNEVK